MKSEEGVKWAAGELGKIYGWGVNKPIAGGAGSAAGLEVVLPHPRTTQPQRLTRLLENERALAALLLAPAVVILGTRSEEHTSELQSLAYLVCRLLLEKKKKKNWSTANCV